MYIPSSFRMEEREALLAFMRAHAFATLVSWGPDGPLASHVPVVIEERGEAIVLTGHLARHNPHAALLDGVAPSLAVFIGPHGYVPAALYAEAQSVPTWNYIAVHATGPARAVALDAERPRVDALMHDMIDVVDPSYHAQYAALSPGFREGMLQGIVPFELHVARLEGKAKLSQNRNPHDQAAVESHLLASDDPAARATGAAMRARRVGGEPAP